mgnify:CR=1 FL=1
MGIGLTIALILSIVVFYILFRIMRRLVPLIFHGIIGIVVFWLFNYFGILRVPIDWVSFLIAAFGGVFGVLIVIFLAAMGVPL